MKQKHVKARINQILIQIHRGFLSPEENDMLSDNEVLDNVPSGHSWENIGEFERRIRCSAFTFRWVKNHLKKDHTMTAYDMLVVAGFHTQAQELIDAT